MPSEASRGAGLGKRRIDLVVHGQVDRHLCATHNKQAGRQHELRVRPLQYRGLFELTLAGCHFAAELAGDGFGAAVGLVVALVFDRDGDLAEGAAHEPLDALLLLVDLDEVRLERDAALACDLLVHQVNVLGQLVLVHRELALRAVHVPVLVAATQHLQTTPAQPSSPTEQLSNEQTPQHTFSQVGHRQFCRAHVAECIMY